MIHFCDNFMWVRLENYTFEGIVRYLKNQDILVFQKRKKEKKKAMTWKYQSLTTIIQVNKL